MSSEADTRDNRICPFSATLAREQFGCRHASQVVRRGGTEFACRSAGDHARCTRLFGKLKAAALPAFGVEDDLTQMPHSVLVKIQFGGLLGLQRLLRPDDATGTVSDIAARVGEAEQHYGSIDAIPGDELVGDMTGYTLSRRRRR